jgi:hypothetical protein
MPAATTISTAAVSAGSRPQTGPSSEQQVADEPARHGNGGPAQQIQRHGSEVPLLQLPRGHGRRPDEQPAVGPALEQHRRRRQPFPRQTERQGQDQVARVEPRRRSRGIRGSSRGGGRARLRRLGRSDGQGDEGEDLDRNPNTAPSTGGRRSDPSPRPPPPAGRSWPGGRTCCPARPGRPRARGRTTPSRPHQLFQLDASGARQIPRGDPDPVASQTPELIPLLLAQEHVP